LPIKSCIYINFLSVAPPVVRLRLRLVTPLMNVKQIWGKI
jgi:hypothetical protein